MGLKHNIDAFLHRLVNVFVVVVAARNFVLERSLRDEVDLGIARVALLEFFVGLFDFSVGNVVTSVS